MKKILYPAVIYFMMGLSIATAEEVKLTTILPQQDQLRGRSGVVGNGYGSAFPYNWDWRTVSLTDNQFYVGGNMGIGTTSPIRALDISSPSGASEMVMEVADGLADYRKWNFCVDGGSSNAQEFFIRQLNDAGSGGNIPFLIGGGAAPQVQLGGTSVSNGGISFSNSGGFQTISTTNGSATIPYNINIVAPNGVYVNGCPIVYWKMYNGYNCIYYKNNGIDTEIFSNDPSYQNTPTYHAHGLVYSDIRLKKDIVTIPDALERLQSIRGVNFRWKKGKGDNALHAGMIAQEVEKVFPEVVQTGKEGMKSITYGQFAGVLVEAVKDLKKEHDELKRQNKTLADEVAFLEKNKEAASR